MPCMSPVIAKTAFYCSNSSFSPKKITARLYMVSPFGIWYMAFKKVFILCLTVFVATDV